MLRDMTAPSEAGARVDQQTRSNAQWTLDSTAPQAPHLQLGQSAPQDTSAPASMQTSKSALLLRASLASPAPLPLPDLSAMWDHTVLVVVPLPIGARL